MRALYTFKPTFKPIFKPLSSVLGAGAYASGGREPKEVNGHADLIVCPRMFHCAPPTLDAQNPLVEKAVFHQSRGLVSTLGRLSPPCKHV